MSPTVDRPSHTPHSGRIGSDPIIRRVHRELAVVVAVLLAAVSCSSVEGSESTGADTLVDPVARELADPADATLECKTRVGADKDLAQQIVDVAESYMDDNGLQSVLLSVDRDGENLVTAQMGDSIEGVPASTSMRFFNGAVVFSYMGTAMLSLAADGELDIDAPIDAWVSGVPGGDRITPRMLMASMSGLRDFVSDETWIDAFYANPFRPFTTDELEAYVFDAPLLFEPGSNILYTHMGFRVAGEVIEAAAGKPLPEVIDERVTGPLGMDATEFTDTVQFDGPVLRTYTDERGPYEETTGWSPAWGVPVGAMQVTNICDLVRSAAGIGSAGLLRESDRETFLNPGTLGKGVKTEQCPQCIPQDEQLHFGLGVTVADDWVMQTPLFTGIAAVQSYLPPKDGEGEGLAIAVANTYGPDGDVGVNGSKAIMVAIADLLEPASPLPPQVR